MNDPDHLAASPDPTSRPLPLAGLRVVEFTHMVMGPTCGMVLADMGAEVIKVEPIERRPHAPPAGRGRRLLPDVQPQQEEHRASTCTSPKAPTWRASWRPAPTWWSRTSSPAPWPSTGSTTPRCPQVNPRLIYVSHKGFLPGPYEHRTRARRGGADDGRPGLHDRAARATRCAPAPA